MSGNGAIRLLVTVCLFSSATGDILSLFNGNPFGGGPPRKLIVKRIGQCVGRKNLPIYLPEMKINTVNRTHTTVSGKVIFREDFPDGWSAGVVVKKCDDFRAAANCEPVLNNIATSDVCTLVAFSGAMYVKYLATIHPKPVCPFRKGVYNVSEIFVDDGVSQFLPGAGSTYWEIRMTGRKNNRLVLCQQVLLNIRPRKRG